MFLEKLFRAFFLPIFWSRNSCEYKKTFFALFSDDFFPNILSGAIRVFLEKLFRAFYSAHFFVMIFVWILKKTFFALFSEDFFQTFFIALFVCFWKIVSRVFFPPFLVHDIRVNIKKSFSHFFPTIFSPTFFAGTIRVFLEKLFRAFYSAHFLSWYSCE